MNRGISCIQEAFQVEPQQVHFRQREAGDGRKMGVKHVQDNLLMVRDFTDPNVWHTVDILEKTRKCKSFTYRGYCKHLGMLKSLKRAFALIPHLLGDLNA